MKRISLTEKKAFLVTYTVRGSRVKQKTIVNAFTEYTALDEFDKVRPPHCHVESIKEVKP